MYPEETSIYYALLVGLTVLLILVLFFVITITRYHRRKSAFEQTSISQQLQYIEDEKERIAIDLHDDLGSLLSAIKMRLHSLNSQDEKLEQHIALAEEQIDVVMEKIRRIARNMMPSLLRRKGLREACAELLNYVTEHTTIHVDFMADEIQATTETEVQLYRITQEILNNIIRHSQARNIYFKLWQKEETISLSIKDDGIGFDENKVLHQSKGSGLKNIIARTEIIKAKIYLTTHSGRGVDFLIETIGLWHPPK